MAASRTNRGWDTLRDRVRRGLVGRWWEVRLSILLAKDSYKDKSDTRFHSTGRPVSLESHQGWSRMTTVSVRVLSTRLRTFPVSLSENSRERPVRGRPFP